ncbi:MAG TPA: hemerythrin family protein [Elusimicrobiota bacterium]|nr:hemerythrin family protein [Elusimicrobiota bacterium]
MALRWTKLLYGTGVELIDAQHRRLFEWMNKLIDAFDRADASDISSILGDLNAYAVKHFRCEERTMAKGNCAALCLNQTEHREFSNKLALLKKEFEINGPTPAVAREFKFFILGWVRTHIQAVDVHLQCTIKQGFRLEAPPSTNVAADGAPPS